MSCQDRARQVKIHVKNNKRMVQYIQLLSIPLGTIEKQSRKVTDRSSRHTGINPEGKGTLLLAAVAFIAVNLVLFCSPMYGWWAYPVLAVTLFIMSFFFYFFRNPVRKFPMEDKQGVVVSPADGTIVTVEEVDEPDHFGDRRIMISVFMSVFSVHANWYPVNGRIIKVEHQDGNFHAAFKPKASTENERSLVVIETPEGHHVMMRQIAGALARRVVTYSNPGDTCSLDSHMGFIKFGSRVDVYLPLGSLVSVKVGQKVSGDLTILAKLPNQEKV